MQISYPRDFKILSRMQRVDGLVLSLYFECFWRVHTCFLQVALRNVFHISSLYMACRYGTMSVDFRSIFTRIVEVKDRTVLRVPFIELESQLLEMDSCYNNEVELSPAEVMTRSWFMKLSPAKCRGY